MQNTDQHTQAAQKTLLVKRNTKWTVILTAFYMFVLVYVGVLQQPLWSSFDSSAGIFRAFLLCIDLFFVIMLWLWVTRHLFTRSPVVAISKKGIQIGKLPTSASDNLFIAWHEIETIASRRFVYTQVLCIYPKDPTLFLTRFGRVKQFLMRAQMHGALINIPQVYMQQSATEVVTQLTSLYAQEVRDAAIQLHS